MDRQAARHHADRPRRETGSASGDDRRAFRLLTTDQAEPILDELWKIADAARAYALRGMSAAEQKQLDQFLLRIKRNLVDSDDEPESRG
jgi:DNA-binding MarR family transcriptional regulator